MAGTRLKDAQGLDVYMPASVRDPTAIVQHIDAYMKQVFVYGRAWDVIVRALLVSDECVLVHVLATDFWIAKNDMVNASLSLAAAERLASVQDSSLTERERLYVKGYACMMQNRLRESLQMFNDLLTLAPSDLFIVKKVQLLSFVLGGRSEMLAVVLRSDVSRACDGRPYFHAMVAFGLEENDRVDEAGEQVQRAMAVEPHDPWAHHVQAHVLYARGVELEQGAQWLEGRQAEWEQCMSFMHGHAWFHTALLRLDLDQFERTREILDRRVWPHRELTDAAAAAPAPAAAAASAAASPGESPSASTLTLPSAAAATSASSASSPASAAESSEDAEFNHSLTSSSFGVPLTTLSFKRQDRFDVEDQNGALNLLWRLELRWGDGGRNRRGSAPSSATAPAPACGASSGAASASPAATEPASAPATSGAPPTVDEEAHAGQKRTTSEGEGSSHSASPLGSVADVSPPADKKRRVSVDEIASISPLVVSTPTPTPGSFAAAPAAPAADAASSCFTLHLPSLTTRWRSVVSSLHLPPLQPLSLFGLLQLYALLRVGRMDQAREMRQHLETEVEQVVDVLRREALKAVLLPIAAAMDAYHSSDRSQGRGTGASRAFELMQPLMGGPPPVAVVVCAAARVDGTAGSPSAPAASGSATGSEANRLSSCTIAPASASARLACLAASGEQLEVLAEWYIELCAEAKQWTELRRCVEYKREARPSVKWYERMYRIAVEGEMKMTKQQQ